MFLSFMSINNSVPNHMGIDVYGEIPTEWFPFNETEHYHPYCEITNWDDQWQVDINFCL